VLPVNSSKILKNFLLRFFENQYEISLIKTYKDSYESMEALSSKA